MTDDRSIERAARSWLEVGPTEAPERAVEAALLQIDSTPQERDWLPWRLPNMATPARVAAAAVIGVIAVGGALYVLAPGSSGPGGPGPTASPTPSVSPAPSLTAAPSVVPSASAVFPAWYTGDQEGAGILPAGEATTRSFKPGTPFNVPEGWVNNVDVPIAYALFPDSNVNEAEYALSGEMARSIFMVTVESPYHVCEAWEKTQGTAAERAAFMVASEAFAASEPVDVTIGGLTGKQVDVQVDPAWKEACPDDPPGEVDRGDLRTRVILLDTPDRGVIVIFVGSLHSAGHEAFLAEAMPIVESFQFEVAP